MTRSWPLLLLAAVLWVFLPLTRHPGDLLVGPQDHGRNDVTNTILPFRGYQRVSLSRFGQLPLWNPYSLGGLPWLGNPQSALFYPPNWLFLLIEPTRLVSWLLVGHHLFAGLGTYRLARRYGCEPGSAVLGGIAFLAAPYYVANTGEGHYNPVCLVAWLPWTLLAFERLRRGERGGVPLTAVCLAMAFFCGHVQELYYLALMLSAFVVGEVLRPIHSASLAPRRLLGAWLLTCVTLVGLVAIDLLPIAAYSRQCVRAGTMSASEVSALSLAPTSLRQLLDPWIDGGPADYRGPGGFYWESLCYFGRLPLALAIVGGWLGRGRFPVRRLVLVGLVAFVFAFGDDTPVFTLAHRFVPGIALFRAPARALFFVSFAVALLAAIGLDELLRRLPRATWRTVASAAASLVVTLELGHHAHGVLRTIPQESIRRNNPLLALTDGRVLASQEFLTDFEGWTAGVERVQGYDPVPLARFAMFAAALSRRGDAAMQMAGYTTVSPDDFRPQLLDLFGVRHVVVERREGERLPPDVTLRGATARELRYDRVERDTVLPRAFVLGAVERLATGDDVVRRLATFDPRKTLLLDDDTLPPGPRQAFRPATIVRYTPNEVVIDAELTAPGYLVLTDTYYPGWRARVDGQPAPIVPANVAFRAVRLEPGRHSVTFAFVPAGAQLGALVTLVTIGAAIAGGVRANSGHTRISDLKSQI